MSPSYQYNLGNRQSAASNLIHDIQTNRQPYDRISELAGQVRNQSEQSGIVPENPPSVVSRIFDVLSRPLYAVANPFVQGIKEFNTSVEEGEDPGFQGMSEVFNPVDLIQNIGRGLAGTEKSTFGEFFGEYPTSRDPGETPDKLQDTTGGRVSAALLGLAADIGLDPTTYLSLGITKGASVAKTTASLANAAQKAEKSGEAAKVGARAVGDLLLNAPKEAKVSRTAQNAARAAARQQHGLDAAYAAQDAARGTLDFKFMGQSFAHSPTLYRGGQQLSETLLKTPMLGNALDAVNVAFRTASKANYGELNDLKRATEAMGVASAEEHTRKFQLAMKQTSRLNRAERQTVAFAIDEDIIDSLKGVKGVYGTDLFEAATLRKRHLDAVTDLEIATGTLSGLERISNYLPHYFRPGSKRDLIKLWKEGRQAEVKALMRKAIKNNPNAKVVSTKHLRETVSINGLNPVTDIDDIISLRYSKMYRDMANKKMSDAFVGEFGLQVGRQNRWIIKHFELTNVPNARYIGKDIFFPQEIAGNIRKIEQVWQDEKVAEGLLHYYDKVLTAAKFLYTVPNPAHHVRNVVGDSTLNFLDGVVNPKRYTQSANMLQAYYRGAKGPTLRVGTMNIDNKTLMDAFITKGAKPGFFRMEFGEGFEKYSVIEKMRAFSERREEFTRMAHFIDVLQKEGKGVRNINDFYKVAEGAATRVRKFNIDYGDLTEFERRFMKRTVPFYTWLRKNIPLQAEMLLMRPGRQAVFPKGLRALEQLTGQDSDGPTIEGMNVLPLWMRQLGSVALTGEGQGRNGIYWNPSFLPVFDIGRFFEGTGSTKQNILSNIVGSTAPQIQFPIEQGLGVNVFTGAPEDVGAGQYVARNTIPSVVRGIYQMATGEKELSTGIPNLLGAGLIKLEDKYIASELRRQQDPMQSAIEERNERAIVDYFTKLFGPGKVPPQWLEYYGVGR